MSGSGEDVTQLLIALSEGDRQALDTVMPAIESELRRIARRYLRRERPDHTLQTNALINEAYLKLIDQRNTRWENRAHFFSICARLMRRILLDHARKKRAAKRWGGQRKVTLPEVAGLRERPVDIIDLDSALTSLTEVSPRQAEVVELRYFAGLTIEEVAEVASISPATVKRDLAEAKNWLHKRLDDAGAA